MGCNSGSEAGDTDSTSASKVDSAPVKEEPKVIEEGNVADKEYTSLYICPGHCKGSGSDKPGTCPVCGMDYMENPNPAE